MPSIECSAILFDLDGTLIDSTEAVVAHWTTFAGENSIDPAVILATSHGQSFPSLNLFDWIRRRTYEVLLEHCPEKANWEYIKEWEADIPRKYGDKAFALPGALNLIHQIESFGGKWGIVTSGTAGLASAWLKVLNIPIPKVFITADLVKEGKPSPEGYLLGRKMLGVANPSDKVVVFEDAAAGVKAGKAAGATVIAVIETHSREALGEAGADYIIDGLHELGISETCGGNMALHF